MLTNSPEESARDLLESFAHEHAVRDVTAVRVGLHLPELLEMLGLDYTEVDTIVDARGRELLGEWDPEKKIIVVSQASPYMKNFTIAHEIAHARLHPGSVKYRDSSAHLLGPQTDPQERDANRFATALLMPSDGVRNAYFCSFDAIFDLGDLKEEQIYRLRLGHQQRITREQIERSRLREIARLVATSSFTDREPLHREFGVSKATMAIRLEELNLVVTRRLASHHVSRPSSHRLAAVVAEQ